ncbi:hypothetical protein Tco_1541682 [Tanacetum coccineum]
MTLDVLKGLLFLFFTLRTRILSIDLYVKCGRVDKAYGLFYGLQKKLMICIQQDVTDEDITRVGPFKIRKTILENDHRKYLEKLFEKEDNTYIISVEDGSSMILAWRFGGSPDQNRRHGLLDPE